MDFVRVPTSLIHANRLNEKRILIYCSLLLTTYGEKVCSVRELTSSCGFSLDRHESGAMRQVIQIISDLSDEWITTEWTDRQTFSYRIKPFRYYGIIHRTEYEAILDRQRNLKHARRRLNHSSILLVLAYVRSHMDSRTEQPHTYYAALKTISVETGLSVRCISSAISELENMKILRVEELPHFKDGNNQWHTAVRIFANYYTFSHGFKRPNKWKLEIERTINNIKSTANKSTGG